MSAYLKRLLSFISTVSVLEINPHHSRPTCDKITRTNSISTQVLKFCESHHCNQTRKHSHCISQDAKNFATQFRFILSFQLKKKLRSQSSTAKSGYLGRIKDKLLKSRTLKELWICVTLSLLMNVFIAYFPTPNSLNNVASYRTVICCVT